MARCPKSWVFLAGSGRALAWAWSSAISTLAAWVTDVTDEHTYETPGWYHAGWAAGVQADQSVGGSQRSPGGVQRQPGNSEL